MIPNGLIGYTGFVGSNLLSQGSFQKLYNSKNINSIENKKFNELWCAGISAVKWWANKHPEDDWNAIQILLDSLKTLEVKHFILISTIDVYPFPVNVDEQTAISPSDENAYGTHRYEVEQFVADNFENYTIIRLPALFGDGLKKNAIYDILHDNQVEKIHSEGVFQFYSLDTVYTDIKKVIESDIRIMNFATEPIRLRKLFLQAFGINFHNEPYQNPRIENVKTRHAHLFDSDAPYIMRQDQIFALAKTFANRERKRLETSG